MRTGSHEYANEADDNVPKPAQSLGTPVPRQKVHRVIFRYRDILDLPIKYIAAAILTCNTNEQLI